MWTSCFLPDGAAPEMEAETWETLLPLAAQAAARQRDWRAAALRKSAGAEGAGLSRGDDAREAAFLRARQRLSEAVDGMLSSGGPAGTAPARGGETAMARQTGDLPREDRKARREAEAVSRILERGARGYDAGFIHY